MSAGSGHRRRSSLCFRGVKSAGTLSVPSPFRALPQIRNEKRAYRREGFSADGKCPSRSGIPQGCCRGIGQNLPLHGGRWGERGCGQRCDNRLLLRQWRRSGGHGWLRGKRPVRRSIAGGLDCRSAERKIFHFRRVPVVTGPGFSSMRKIIFGQQPPKQPLGQNKNGSRFACFASC